MTHRMGNLRGAGLATCKSNGREGLSVRRLDTLDDAAARAEARRLALVAAARWEKEQGWFNIPTQRTQAADDGASPFEMGMLALFRCARGEDVPGFIVRSFIEDLLTMMFAGLGSGVLAIPAWNKMADRPWALAWRLAETRLDLADGQSVKVDDLAVLCGLDGDDLESALRALSAPTSGLVAAAHARRILDSLCVPASALPPDPKSPTS